MPKEMLPVVDKPAIQYVVEEAVAAGLTDILMITGRNKSALENHFDRVGELEATLLKKGDVARLRKVNYATDLADVHYVRQGDPKGLGHAVLRAKMHVGHEPFAVLLGDDIIDERDVLLSRMIEVQSQRDCTVIALLEVDPSQAEMYGIATVEATDEADVVQITGLVEKPTAGTAPSNLAIIGRYVLRPEIFDILEVTEPGKGGEIQLTDALQVLAANHSSMEEPFPLGHRQPLIPPFGAVFMANSSASDIDEWLGRGPDLSDERRELNRAQLARVRDSGYSMLAAGREVLQRHQAVLSAFEQSDRLPRQQRGLQDVTSELADFFFTDLVPGEHYDLANIVVLVAPREGMPPMAIRMTGLPTGASTEQITVWVDALKEMAA